MPQSADKLLFSLGQLRNDVYCPVVVTMCGMRSVQSSVHYVVNVVVVKYRHVSTSSGMDVDQRGHADFLVFLRGRRLGLFAIDGTTAGRVGVGGLELVVSHVACKMMRARYRHQKCCGARRRGRSRHGRCAGSSCARKSPDARGSVRCASCSSSGSPEAR